MPIEVQDFNGQTHTFPDGTPPDAIRAQMMNRLGLSPQAPQIDPQNKPAMGVAPSPMQVNPAGEDIPLPDMSPRAQRLQKNVDLYAMQGDGRTASVYDQQLLREPSMVLRQKEMERVAAQNAQRKADQEAASRALNVFDRMASNAHMWFERAPEAATNAIGPIQSTDTFQMMNSVPLIGNKGAQNFHTRLQHDIEAVSTQLRKIQGGGHGSDAVDKTFRDAVGKAIQANDPDAFFSILESARNTITNAGQLPEGYQQKGYKQGTITPQEAAVINKYAKTKIDPNDQRIVEMGASAMPVNATNATPAPTKPASHASQLNAGAIIQTTQGPMMKGSDGKWYPANGQQ